MLILCVVVLGVMMTPATAQVSSLMVNGSSSGFTMASGDAIQWEYDVDTAATVRCEFWFDLNQNGTIEPGTDRLFAFFLQTDGVMEGDGPPDLDGEANGHVYFDQPVGIAPAAYVLTFISNGDTAAVAGTVTPLASPTHTVSGYVTPPTGKGAENILVELNKDGNGNNMFWNALTDSTGLFVVALYEDSSGSQWRLRVNTPFPPNVITPEDISITLTGNDTGYNFTYLPAAAQVAGVLQDELGNPVIDRGIRISSNSTSFSRSVRTDQAGFFQIGVLAGELADQPLYIEVVFRDTATTQELHSRRSVPVIASSDSFFLPLKLFSVNAQITGRILINGNPPGFPIQITASNPDSAESRTWCDPVTGEFTMPVSDKISTYELYAGMLPGNYSGAHVQAAAGDTGVLIAVTTTGIGNNERLHPTRYALGNNYPNPFNPMTRILYTLPVQSNVRLTVFNLLGQEVAELVSGTVAAGGYEVFFNAADLPSGVYFYRLDATSLSDPSQVYTKTEKMLLTK